MIQAHGEAFCRFHPAYGASCSFHKKHPAVLQKHCTVEVFPPGNPSDQDPVVLFSSLYALLGELLPQKAPFLIHRRQPPLHQKMKADLRLTLRSLYVCQICNCWQCEPAQWAFRCCHLKHQAALHHKNNRDQFFTAAIIQFFQSVFLCHCFAPSNWFYYSRSELN